MERSTAKTLSMIPPIIMIVIFLMMFLSMLITVVMLLPLGLLFFLDPILGFAMIFMIIIFLVIFLIFLVLPGAALFIGYFKVYKPISEEDFSDTTRVWLIIAMILCFIGGGGWIGWIAGGLYIFILVNWEKLKNPPPKYYYPPQAQYPPPGYQQPPPGYYQNQPPPGYAAGQPSSPKKGKKKSGKRKEK